MREKPKEDLVENNKLENFVRFYWVNKNSEIESSKIFTAPFESIKSSSGNVISSD